ncbi:MAG: glutamate 5-kinase, partial [Pseudomonadota bacterium]
MTAANASHAEGALRAARRLVVKVGSAILCDDKGPVREEWLATLADDIADLRREGREVVIVTSGAIALGRMRLGLKGALRLDEKQAASAAGQAALVGAWQRAFDRHGVNVAQILLTLEDTENRRRYLNARATFSTLLELGALPLVNENDTIATAEIRYGDNDRLAAHAAQIVGADLLVIL